MRSEIDLPITLGGLVVTATPVLFMNEAKEPSRTVYERRDVFAPDRSATHYWSPTLGAVGDALVVAAPAAAAAATLPLYAGRDWADTYTDFLLLAESMVVTSLINQLVRNSIRRPRPYMYSDDFSRRRGNHEDLSSFFSGHAASTFAVGTALWRIHGLRYPEQRAANALIGAAAMTAGLAEGALRVLSGGHFWTDAVAGAVVGLSVGWLTVELHRTEDDVSGRIALQGVGPGWIALGMDF